MADNTTDTNVQGSTTDEQPPAGPQQVHGKMLTEEESHEWGNLVEVNEPEAKTEQNVLRKEFEDAASIEQEEAAETATDEQTEAEQEEEQSEPEEVETQYVEDPGEFQPSDYSFEVAVYDNDTNRQHTVKVTSLEQWESLLEEMDSKGENMGSSLAVNKAFRQASKMETGLERDKADYDKQKAEYEQAVANQQQMEQRNTQIFNEMNYLINRGDLPKLTQEEMNNLNWSDKAVLSAHPNIKPHAELLAFMRKENETRAKAGLAPLNSALDAYNAMQLDARRNQDIQTKKQAGEQRRQAGARVASASQAPIAASAPKGIMIGRVGRGLQNLGQNWEV